MLGEKRLLAQRGAARCAATRAVRAARRARSAAAAAVGRRNVLELEGDDVHAARERAHGVEIVVGRDDLEVGDLAGRRVVLGRERVDAVAHAPRGDREHAARAGRRRARRPSAPGAITCDRLTAACPGGPGGPARRGTPCSRSRSSGRALARMRDGQQRRRWRRRPVPIASVPTGTPRGICTIDSSESRPLSARLCTGTPSTGSDRVRRHHARQVRGAAGARDDHLEAARFGARARTRPCSRACGAPRRRGTRAARRSASASRRRGASSPSPTCCP